MRLCKIYATKKGDWTLLDEMAALLSQNKEIKAASNQIFSPIHINDLVRGIRALQEQKAMGLYNLGGSEKISRYDLALRIAKKMGIEEFLVKEVSLDDLPCSFKRPKKTILNIDKIKKKVKLSFHTLDESIECVVEQYEIDRKKCVGCHS